jgi:hypothetical protein
MMRSWTASPTTVCRAAGRHIAAALLGFESNAIQQMARDPALQAPCIETVTLSSEWRLVTPQGWPRTQGRESRWRPGLATDPVFRPPGTVFLELAWVLDANGWPAADVSRGLDVDLE